MPVLAALITVLSAKFALLFAGLRGTKLAFRIAGLMFVAGAYIACVIGFSYMVAPWWNAWTSTGYGAVVGLAFPPVAGPVVQALVTFWGCVIAYRYTASLTKAATK